jgi:hypothetical protein
VNWITKEPPASTLPLRHLAGHRELLSAWSTILQDVVVNKFDVK